MLLLHLRFGNPFPTRCRSGYRRSNPVFCTTRGLDIGTSAAVKTLAVSSAL